MARHQGPVLADTNVILECHRTASWRALTGAYKVETVQDCIMETQTGFQRRLDEQRIDETELRASLAAIHEVGTLHRAEMAVRMPSVNLDIGEAALWAHAAQREDAWLLCGPDRASLLFGIRLGFRERLVSLEGLLSDAGHRPNPTLRMAYTKRWHDSTVGQLILSEELAR